MPSNTTQLDKARQLYQAKDLESAAALLESLVKELPIDHRALRLLFKVYAEERRWVGPAERTYRRLLSAGLPESQLYTLHLDMARVYHAAGQAPKSLEVIEKAIALNPPIREAYDVLVQVHERQNSLTVAAETLQQSVTQQPDNADLHCVLAKIYEKMRWWVEARDAAKTAIHLKPNMAEPQHILRRVEKQLKSNPRLFQEAARRRKAAGDIKGMLHHWFDWAEATQEADAFVAVGELCEQHGQLGYAEYAFNRAINLRHDHPHAREGLRRVQAKKQPPIRLDKPRYDVSELEQLFKWFVQINDLRGAVDFLQRYRDQYPNYVPILLFLARAYQEAGQLDLAVRMFQEAIDRSFDAGKPDLYCELGTVYLAQGQRDKAKRAFRTALHFWRDHPEATRRLNALYAEEVPPAHVIHRQWEQFRTSGRYEEALDLFKDFREIDPHNPYPYIYTAYAYEELGRIDRAYQAHKHAAFLFHTEDAFVKLGRFCVKNDLLIKATEAFQQALVLNPRNRPARLGLANIPRLEKCLQSRTGRPNDQYLHAIWNLAKRKGWIGETIKYFAALAGEMVDNPTLFTLLGHANTEFGNIRAATIAYQHAAALRGTAKAYVNLGDFCFRHALEAMAAESYQTALALNPFHQHARGRLASLKPSCLSLSACITGHRYSEDLARDLRDSPGDRTKAEKLRDEFIKRGAVENAETTYQLLQSFHPEQITFVHDLAQVYLMCNKPQPPTKPVPPMESVAPTIATEWYMRLC